MEYEKIRKIFNTKNLIFVSIIFVIILVIIISRSGFNFWDIKPDNTSGIKIPTDKIGVGVIKDGKQTDIMSVETNHYSPSILVLQKGIPVKWIIDVEDLNICNQILSIPYLGKNLTLKKGRNEIVFTPGNSFHFNCSMRMLYGYIKVVDNIEKINIKAIKKEVSAIKLEKLNISSCCGY